MGIGLLSGLVGMSTATLDILIVRTVRRFVLGYDMDC